MIRQALQIIERTFDSNFSSSICGYFNWLSNVAPVYSVHGSQVKIIQGPGEFYDILIDKCQKAENRILLTSLYLGNGNLSENLVAQLEERLSNIKKLDVRILLDANRGSRGKKNSRKMLLPLVRNYPSCQVSMFHTPVLRGPLRYILPQRYNELVGLQHMKIYLFDDTVIMSGANLSEDYFTNRQDRYVMVSNCKNLADFYWGLVDKLSEVSLTLDSSDNLIPKSIHPYKSPKEDYLVKAKELIWGHCEQSIKNKTKSNPGDDTWLFPVVELPPFDVHQDSEMTKTLIQMIPRNSKVTLSTGYFNLTSSYTHSINNSGAKFQILMAHPTANGFDKTAWPTSGIPKAYTAIASEFLKDSTNSNLSLHEYQRKGWTYHVKGLWLTPPTSQGPIFTIIGSSNFGVRSVFRDLESSLGVLTVNDGLRRALREEQESYLEHCSGFTRETADSPLRVTPLWVRTTLAIFRSFF